MGGGARNRSKSKSKSVGRVLTRTLHSPYPIWTVSVTTDGEATGGWTGGRQGLELPVAAAAAADSGYHQTQPTYRL